MGTDDPQYVDLGWAFPKWLWQWGEVIGLELTLLLPVPLSQPFTGI